MGFIAMNTAITSVGNTEMKKTWTGFKGTKNIFKVTVNGKPAAKTDAKTGAKTPAKPAAKPAAKTDATKKRRLQAAAAPSGATISATGGVDASSYTPGVTIPNDVAGDGQASPSASNLIK